jgi:hypothetical protein
MSSMWDTVMAMGVFWPPCEIRVSVRFVASVEKYRRDPFAQENEPFFRTGPNATPVSLRDRSPFS